MNELQPLPSKMPNTNSLNKKEHGDMMAYLEEHGPTPLRSYLLHLMDEGNDEPFMKLLNDNSHIL